MAPVPLPARTPNLPFTNSVNLPQLAQDPPSTLDILHERGQSDNISTAAAYVYEDSVLAAASNGIRLQGALQAVLGPALQAALPAALLAALPAALQAALLPIETKIDQLCIFTAKNYNRTLVDGKAIPFAPVPFPDGTLPSANINTPTALTTVDAIDGLPYPELREYCTKYYPGRVYGQGQQLQERRRLLREAIGCSASLV
ncbi:hypothetical protein B0H11DRAFT_1998036 [Mycena galericulata]|nr:hypothetical protein B0H11DRAFT_1998036 [Mycena galericulata]